MILKQEKEKIIIKINENQKEENIIKQKLEELIKKGLKDIIPNNKVILDLGDIGLNEYEFKKLIELMNSYSIPISSVRSTNPIVKMISLHFGIPVDAPSIINTNNKLIPRGIPIEDKNNPNINKATKNEEDNTNITNQDILIYKKNLRSGSILESEKTIILIGNVNPGAEVRSSNNIIILGKLMGTAHAGYPNNNKSIIFCLKLKNPLIKIANMVGEFNEQEIKKQIKSNEISNIIFYPDGNSIKMEIIKDNQKE
jgi:septum site-determining protein MinC